MLPKNAGAEIFLDQLCFDKKNNIFNWLNQNCKISQKEMLKTFNCGIGMILIIKRKDLEKFLAFSKKINQPIKVLGNVTNNKGVIFK